MSLTRLSFRGKRREEYVRSHGLQPAHALLHPSWLAAVTVLALNDHVFKGAGILPVWLTGKASDFAGLFAAPVLLAALVRARSRRALFACYAATALVFTAIKVSASASSAFAAALALAHLPWNNTVDPTDLLALVALVASWGMLLPRMLGNAPFRLGKLASWVAAAFALPVMLGSGNVGGANTGGHAPGSGDEGVFLGSGEIAVSPSGLYFLSKKGDQIVIGTLETRAYEVVAGLPTADVLAFWSRARGEGFFLAGSTPSGDRVVSYDLASRSVQWSIPSPVAYPHMKANEKDGSLVVWSDEALFVLDPDTGAKRGSLTPDRAIRDVDLRDLNDEIIVTTDTWWDGANDAAMPFTTVQVLRSLDAGVTCQITAPNCADEFVVARGGTRAFLAPTWCSRDPVSVLDLENCQLEKQLPGFGPVALSQSGNTAVAFLDRDTTDPTAPAMPPEVAQSDSRYHLMFINVGSLAYGTLAVGDELPRYAVTPDGKMLLVDAFLSENNVRILDIETRSLRTVQGAYVLLDDYVMLPDSQHVYGIQQGLFELDVATAMARTIGLSFTPEGINMTPDGDTLLLRDRDELVHLFDVQTQVVTGTMGR